MLIPSKPRISIVICTYNRAELLRTTLDSIPALKAIEYAEVLIVDNNSTDLTRRVSQSFIGSQPSPISARYLFEQTQGLSAARNRGITEAQGDIIAFLDDDAIPCSEWITTILTTLDSRQDVDAIGGKIHPRFQSSRPDWLITAFELPYTIVDMGDLVKEYPGNRHPFGANMAIRKSFLENHLFPTNLGRIGDLLLSGEESWLFQQMKKQQKTILYHPAMAVVHFIPDSRLTQDWIKKRYYFQGVTNGYMSKGLKSRFVLLGLVAAKLLYIGVASLFARTKGRKLLVTCRKESIRGTVHTLHRRRNRRLTR
ncbi:glycosyltransferase [Paenibacillus sp. N3.4]|uniref:glycosyltransferase n=1 Tax=Paenibacillus sp. N3.4 TaxID=2603222 RepID=UPI0021C3BAEA|nr:glycosyltransferase [Paenibacillus sp. N3.4]